MVKQQVDIDESIALFMGKYRKLSDLETEVTYPIPPQRKSQLISDFDFLMNVGGEWMYIQSANSITSFTKLIEHANNYSESYKIINIRSGRVVRQG